MEYGTVDLQAVASINCGGASRQISAEEYMIQNKLNNTSSFTLKIPYQATLIPSDKIALQGEILVQRMDGMFAVDSRKPIVRSCLNGMPFHFVPDNKEAEDEINVLRVKIGKVFKQMEHKLRVVGLNKYTTKPDEDLVCVIAGLMTTKNNSLFPIERGDVIVAALPSITRGKPQITNSNTSPHRRTMEGRPLNEHTLTDISCSDDGEYLMEMAKTKEFGAICQMVASYAATYVLRTVKFNGISDTVKGWIRRDHADGSHGFIIGYGDVFTKAICNSDNVVDEDTRKLMAESLGDAIQMKILSDMEQRPKMENIARDMFTPLRDIGYLLTSHVASRIIGVAQSDAASNKEFDIFIHPPQNLRRIPIPLLSPAPNKDDPSTYGNLYSNLSSKFPLVDITAGYFHDDNSGRPTYTRQFNSGFKPSKRTKFEKPKRGKENPPPPPPPPPPNFEKPKRGKENPPPPPPKTDPITSKHIQTEEQQQQEEVTWMNPRTGDVNLEEEDDAEEEEKEDDAEEELKTHHLNLTKTQAVIITAAGFNLLNPNVPELILLFKEGDKGRVTQVYGRCVSALIGIVTMNALTPAVIPAIDNTEAIGTIDRIRKNIKILNDAIIKCITCLFRIKKENIAEAVASINSIPLASMETISENARNLFALPNGMKDYNDHYVVKQSRTLWEIVQLFEKKINANETQNIYDYTEIGKFGFTYTDFSALDLNDEKRQEWWVSGARLDIFVSGVCKMDAPIEKELYDDVFKAMMSIENEYIPFKFEYSSMNIRQFDTPGWLVSERGIVLNETENGTVQKKIVSCIDKYENEYVTKIWQQIDKLARGEEYEVPQPGNIPPLAYVMTYVYATRIFSLLNSVKLSALFQTNFIPRLKRETLRYGGDIKTLVKKLYDLGLYHTTEVQDERYIQYVLDIGNLPKIGEDRQTYINAERKALTEINNILSDESKFQIDNEGYPDLIFAEYFSSRYRMTDITAEAMARIRGTQQPDFGMALAHMHIMRNMFSKAQLEDCKIKGVISDETSATMNKFAQNIPEILNALKKGFMEDGHVNFIDLVKTHKEFDDAHATILEQLKNTKDGKGANVKISIRGMKVISTCLSSCPIKYIQNKDFVIGDVFGLDIFGGSRDKYRSFFRSDVTLSLLMATFRTSKYSEMTLTEFSGALLGYLTISPCDRLINLESFSQSKNQTDIVNVPVTETMTDAVIISKVAGYLRCYEYTDRLACYKWAKALKIDSAVEVKPVTGMTISACGLHVNLRVCIWVLAKQILSMANKDNIWGEIARLCFSLIGCSTEQEFVRRCEEQYPAFKKPKEFTKLIKDYTDEANSKCDTIMHDIGLSDSKDQKNASKVLANKDLHTRLRKLMVEMYTKIHGDFFVKITS